MSSIASIIIKNDLRISDFFCKKSRCKLLNYLMIVITQLGSTTFTIVLPMLFLLSGSYYNKQYNIIIGKSIIVVTLTSEIVVHITKRIVGRQRPYRKYEHIKALIKQPCKYSFPSGHTCSAFSIALVLNKHIPQYGNVFIVLAVLVGISRVYLGVHYFTDVIVGAVVAMLGFAIIF